MKSSFGGVSGCRNKRRLSKFRSRTAASASVGLVEVSTSRPREYRPICTGSSFCADDSSVRGLCKRAVDMAPKEDIGPVPTWFVREGGGLCCWSSGVGGTTLARETNVAPNASGRIKRRRNSRRHDEHTHAVSMTLLKWW